MREIDKDAEPVALGDDLLAEIRESLVLGLLGLEVADRIAGIVHELNNSDAGIIGSLELADTVIEEGRALDGEHHVRIALERRVDVVRAERSLEFLLGDMRLDTSELLTEPGRWLLHSWASPSV